MIKRWFHKVLVWLSLKSLPAEIKCEMMQQGLHNIVDMPERSQRASTIKHVCSDLRDKYISEHDNKVAVLKQQYDDKISRASKNILAPSLPYLQSSVDQGLLDEKTEAHLNIQMDKEEVISLPNITTMYKVISFMMLILSVVANYYTFSALFGNDFMGGSEKLSMAVILIFSFTLVAVEIFGFYFLLTLLPCAGLRIGLAKMLGILGAVLLIVSVGLTIISRTELGNSITTSTSQSMTGKIE